MLVLRLEQKATHSLHPNMVTKLNESVFGQRRCPLTGGCILGPSVDDALLDIVESLPISRSFWQLELGEPSKPEKILRCGMGRSIDDVVLSTIDLFKKIYENASKAGDEREDEREQDTSDAEWTLSSEESSEAVEEPMVHSQRVTLEMAMSRVSMLPTVPEEDVPEVKAQRSSSLTQGSAALSSEACPAASGGSAHSCRCSSSKDVVQWVEAEYAALEEDERKAAGMKKLPTRGPLSRQALRARRMLLDDLANTLRNKMSVCFLSKPLSGRALASTTDSANDTDALFVPKKELPDDSDLVTGTEDLGARGSLTPSELTGGRDKVDTAESKTNDVRARASLTPSELAELAAARNEVAEKALTYRKSRESAAAPPAAPPRQAVVPSFSRKKAGQHHAEGAQGSFSELEAAGSKPDSELLNRRPLSGDAPDDLSSTSKPAPRPLRPPPVRALNLYGPRPVRSRPRRKRRRSTITATTSFVGVETRMSTPRNVLPRGEATAVFWSDTLVSEMHDGRRVYQMMEPSSKSPQRLPTAVEAVFVELPDKKASQ